MKHAKYNLLVKSRKVLQLAQSNHIENIVKSHYHALGVYAEKGKIRWTYILVGYIRGAYILEEKHLNWQSVKLITFLFFPDFVLTSSLR